MDGKVPFKTVIEEGQKLSLSPEPRSMELPLPLDAIEEHYDLVVIGGGPAGVAAAIKAVYLGHRALIVDKPKWVNCGATRSGDIDPTVSVCECV